jgi:hypothetical protein
VPENYAHNEKEARDNEPQEDELDLDRAVNTLNPDMKWYVLFLELIDCASY